jgi:signal transduction histidine kinase
MRIDRRHLAPWLLGWVLLVLAGGLAIVRWDIAQRRAAFETDARIAHRLLSQRAVQNEAILETLALLGRTERALEGAEARLTSLYPQLVSVRHRIEGSAWADVATRAFLDAAEAKSREARHAVLGTVDVPAGRFTMVLASDAASWALEVDVAKMVPWEEWPLDRTGPVRAELVEGDRIVVLVAGAPAGAQPAGLTPGFAFDKVLAAPSQPFELRVRRATGPAEWPWPMLLVWSAVCAVALAAAAAWLRGRRARRRAEELLRIGQVARLNALGELAGGIAHELNQPLAAALANTQAARRMLDDDPPETTTAREAMTRAEAQTRRAAEVVARLRRQLESPDTARPRVSVVLRDVVDDVLDLLEPQLARRGIRVTVTGDRDTAYADPVALEQIVHNLVGNAMQALEAVPVSERRLAVAVTTAGDRAMLAVTDTGPGIAADVLPHVFEPFFTTKGDGLGLGLSLCESLARSMDGTLAAENMMPRGAMFRLTLPRTATSDVPPRSAGERR